jgi:hypothetical protein
MSMHTVSMNRALLRKQGSSKQPHFAFLCIPIMIVLKAFRKESRGVFRMEKGRGRPRQNQDCRSP